MPPELRFQVPKSDRRPYGSHRYDAWSPKVGRRVVLFGQRALRAWVAIEADPTIVGFCERPLILEYHQRPRVIDFWVRRTTAEEELWLLLRAKEQTADATGEGSVDPGFRHLRQKERLTMRLLSSEKPKLTDEEFRNWGTALRYLAANRRPLKYELVDRIRDACRRAGARAAGGAFAYGFEPSVNL